MAPHSSTLAWKIPWTEEPGRLPSMGSQRVGQDWATSLSLFTFMHWGRKWKPTPVFLPEESQGWGSLVGCWLWGRTESDMTERLSLHSHTTDYYSVIKDTDTCYSVDEPWKPYGKWKKSVTKHHILNDPIHMKNPEVNSLKQKAHKLLLGAGWGITGPWVLRFILGRWKCFEIK